MTTVSAGGGFSLAVSPKKAGLNHRLSFLETTAIILPKSSNRVSCGGICQDIFHLQPAMILDQDDAGNLLMTGSIGGVTASALAATSESVMPL
jgi:hypothetical protein